MTRWTVDRGSRVRVARSVSVRGPRLSAIASRTTVARPMSVTASDCGARARHCQLRDHLVDVREAPPGTRQGCYVCVTPSHTGAGLCKESLGTLVRRVALWFPHAKLVSDDATT